MEPEEAAGGMTFSFGLNQEIAQCLQEADEVRQSILSSSGSNDLERGHRELDLVMVRLECQFRDMLVSLPFISFDDDSSSDSSFSSGRTSFRISISKVCMSPPVGQSNDTVAPLEILHHFQIGSPNISSIHPPEGINCLQRIAEQMISSGYTQECVQAYRIIRKVAVEASFQNLGLEEMSLTDIQMLESDGLDKKVSKWIAAATICVQELFVNEKRLFEQTFEGSSLCPVTKYSCFMETVNGPAMQMLSFAQTVSSSRRFPEKIFSISDLHNALSNLLPEMEKIFEPGRLGSIAAEAVETLAKLADAARVILLEFEDTLLHEISKVPVPGGGIHPMARYVMNYMKALSSFKQTLTEIIVSKPASLELITSDDIVKGFLELEGKSNLALHINWITTVLQLKLKEKSKQYKDPSLAHLFMMNNVHYIVQKIKGSPELREMIGDDYLRKLIGQFQLSAVSYQRTTWGRVLHCLREEGLHVSASFSSGSGVSKSALRKRFKTFNATFEEVRRTQVTWLVPEIQLREDLNISISQKLIPAYRSFLRRYRSHLESEKYIRYSAEDLEIALLDFFEQHSKS